MNDVYNIFMVLKNSSIQNDCWWQGEANDSNHALEKAWAYAKNDYKSEPISWDIETLNDEELITWRKYNEN